MMGPFSLMAKTIDNHVVALVNGEPITRQEIVMRQQVWPLISTIENKNGAAPSQADILEELIVEKAQMQWMKERGVEVPASLIDAQVQFLAFQKEASLSLWLQKLAQAGMSSKDYRQWVQYTLMLEQVKQELANEKARVTEAQTQAWIATLKAPQQTQLRLLQWTLPLSEQATPQEVKTAQVNAQYWADQLKKGVPPQKITQEISSWLKKPIEEPDMGLKEGAKYPELFVRATQALALGQVAPVIRSGAGYHILLLAERKTLPLIAEKQTQVRHILLRLNQEVSSEAQKTQLSELKKAILNQQVSFENAAAHISEDGSSQQGGMLGWVRSGVFVPEFEKVMNELPVGQISDPVISRFGWHLIQVLDRTTQALDEKELNKWAQEQIKAQKIQEAWQAWTREIRFTAFVDKLENPL